MKIDISAGAIPETASAATATATNATTPQAATTGTTTGSTSAEPAPVPNQDPVSFIDEPEMLRRLPISRRTLCVWVANGQIPVVKINHRILFHWPSVETALLNLQRGVK